MEINKKQTVKAKRMAAPFYSLSTRHHGQTPSEIIREARASVMNMPVPDLKPVFTNRPFTPKEKERTLFGNAKKRISRPPSAFSLSYLKEQDTSPRIKLPVIGITSQKKIDRDMNEQSNQSLDNLIEEYEAEILQEQIEILQQDLHCLPYFRKTHSSPDERKVMQTFSLNEKIPDKPTEKSIYTISQRCTQNIVPCFADNLYNHSKIFRQHESDFHDDSYQEKGERRYNFCSVNKEVSFERLFFVNNKEKFGHEVTINEIKQDCLSADISHIETHYKEIEKDKEENLSKVDILKNNLNRGFLKEEKSEEIQDHLTISISRETSEMNKNRQEKEYKDTKLSNTNINIRKSKIETDKLININAHMQKSSTEKRIGPDLISDYLALLNNPPLDRIENQREKSKEILDLYETAEYYDINLAKNCNAGENSEVMDTNNSIQFENEKKIKENKGESTNYLKMIRSNIENFDEKMKQLDNSIEMFQEKLNQTNIQSAIKLLKYNDNKYIFSGDVKYNEKNDKKYHKVKIKTLQKDVQRKFINENKDFIMTEDKPETVGWDGFWKNSYYLNTGESEKSGSTEENKLDNLDQFVARLITMNKNDHEHREIANTLNEMYIFMKDKNIFHNKVINKEVKINILKSLYNFANNEDPKILLNMARIVFGLRIENNLSAACKIVFKVARSDENDYLFLQLDDILELLLQGIGLSSPLDAPESCIYGYGALKFLTMNHQILNRLTNLGILDLLILHLKMINSAKLEGFNVNEQTQHALFQLTGALRNVAAGDGVLPLFITTNSIPVICKILDSFRHCEDLVTNISRILSLLSADENAIHIFMSFDNILGMLIELIEMYKSNDKILIRFAYSLGNIVAYNDLARIQLSRYESSVTVLVKTLQLYADKDLELRMKQKSKTCTGGEDADIIDDVIVKVIRIIANMCMNPVVGGNLSPANGNEKNSLQLTQLLATLLKRKEPGTALLACLGCLNNISYYSSNHSSLVDITEGIIRVLGLPDEQCQAEAARVLGNLTRHKEIRDVIFNIGGMDQLMKLLNSRDKEVFRSTCGAFVNLMLDSETRKLFIEIHGIDKLVAGLENFSGDWLFASLICRAIWNSCAEDMERVTSYNNVEKLMNFLANSLDEENESCGDAAWDEFAILATDLLEKINAHFESI